MSGGGVIRDTAFRIDQVVVREVFLSRLHTAGFADGLTIHTEGEEVEEVDVRHIASALEISRFGVDILLRVLIDSASRTKAFNPLVVSGGVDVEFEVCITFGLIFSPSDTSSGSIALSSFELFD